MSLNTKVTVKNRGIGFVEAICNDKPNYGKCFSFAVRLRKDPNSLHWFSWDEVTAYDGPEEDQDHTQRKRKSQEEYQD